MDRQHRATVLLRKLDFEDIDGVRLPPLDPGTDPNEQGARNKSALHRAIMRDRSAEIVQLLPDRGADVHQPRGDGATPFQLAVEYDRAELLDILRNAGGT